MKSIYILFTLLIISTLACNSSEKKDNKAEEITEEQPSDLTSYIEVGLSTDLAQLEEYERAMLPHLIKAADIMNELFWVQAYGDRKALFANIKDDDLLNFARINYGPWDRLNGDKPFIEGVGEKPLGANIYPADITKEEFEDAGLEDEKGQYSMVRRNDEGKLYTIPYHEFFKDQLTEASNHIKAAAELCENEELKTYLELRAEALLTDDFDKSDIAWLNMKTNGIDIIIGPIEHYEDKLYNYRTAYESYVLVKDKEWSAKLAKYVTFLPQLQSELPVDPKYKQETPSSDGAQLNAYDVIFYAGDCNAGSKTIAVNLPNDEQIQVEHGTRRSQLKNAMKAKFDHILLPISEVLISEDQRKHITFNAFFSNTMFHEVAHGLGIKNTVNGKGTVREALAEEFSALEEGKADILGLYMVTSLKEMGELEEGELMDYYVTFMASIFRSVRFGASSAHGKANMLRFNYFKDKEAFKRNEDGTYSVDMAKMKEAVKSLTAMILKLQGDGDKDAVIQLMEKDGIIHADLEADLQRLEDAEIPVDVVFKQGIAHLGL
ncbi:Zn-dependent hydrolase [bacterium]|nr:Zn-dependent hydrolase [bacterium]